MKLWGIVELLFLYHVWKFQFCRPFCIVFMDLPMSKIDVWTMHVSQIRSQFLFPIVHVYYLLDSPYGHVQKYYLSGKVWRWYYLAKVDGWRYWWKTFGKWIDQPKRLLIAPTNLGDFSLVNCWWFSKIHQISPCQTFPLYGLLILHGYTILLTRTSHPFVCSRCVYNTI